MWNQKFTTFDVDLLPKEKVNIKCGIFFIYVEKKIFIF